MPLLDRVREYVARHGMVEPGDRVIVAVSGGPDSLALAHVLHRLAPEWRLSLHLFHMDHGLRGEASRADAAFVAEFARDLALPLTTVTLRPGELEALPGSLEDNARRRRYAEMARLARAIGAQRAATGHTRNDQAETVLMRLLRGSGTGGLAGIPPVRRHGDLVIIRPLLGISREEILEYCRSHGLTPRVDASNLEGSFLRNRIRLEVLPFLTERFGEAVVENLAQSAELLREDDRLLTELAREACGRCGWQEVEAGPGNLVVELDGTRLVREPPALARRVVRMAVQRVSGSAYGPGLAIVNRVLDLAGRTDGSRSLDLPQGVRLSVAYGRCRFARRSPGASPGGDCRSPVWPLAVPGETPIPALGVTVVVEVAPAAAMPARLAADEEWFDPVRLPGPLAVRTRRPGDRLWPVGMQGSKKLQDILVDAKVPRQERDGLPVLVAGDTVVWVPGICRDRRFRPDRQSHQALRVVVRSGPAAPGSGGGAARASVAPVD